MDKNEILSKSVKENSVMDERDKHIRTCRDAFSLWGVIVLGTILMFIKIYCGQSPSDIISLFFILVATGSFYEAIKTKKWIHIMSTIVYSVLTICFFFRFCAGSF